MQPREKLLAAVVGTLVALAIVWFAGRKWLDAVAARRARITALEQQVAEKQAKVDRGRVAEARLTAWRAASLPDDRELARSHYKNWLLGLVERAKFSGAELSPQTSQGRKGTFDRLGFTITGSASLEQLTQWLFEFYQAGYLHQVRTMLIAPAAADGKQLRLTLGVEAAVLRGAPKQAPERREPADRLAYDQLKTYRDTIVRRNLFAEYAPPPPVARREAPKPVEVRPTFDAAKFAFLTAILEIEGRPQAWLNVRTTGKTLKLHEGDQFEVGQLKAKVARIGPREIELDAGGKRLVVPLGQSLRGASSGPPGGLNTAGP
jgi:hypothetical protein